MYDMLVHMLYNARDERALEERALIEEPTKERLSKEAQQDKPRSAIEDRSVLLAVFHLGTQVGIFRSPKSRSNALNQ